MKLVVLFAYISDLLCVTWFFAYLYDVFSWVVFSIIICYQKFLWSCAPGWVVYEKVKDKKSDSNKKNICMNVKKTEKDVYLMVS